MKILFYLESFPVHNNYKSFISVGEKVLKMLQDDYRGKIHNTIEPDEVKILVSRHYAPLQKKYQLLQPAFLKMTKEENNFLYAYKQGCNEKEESDLSLFYHSVFERIRSEIYNFDTIVYWTANSIVKRYCDQHGLFSVAMDFGSLREPFYDSLHIDALGLNENAMSSYVDLDLLEDIPLEQTRTLLPMMTSNGMKIEDALYAPIKSKHVKAIYSKQTKVLITLQLQDENNCALSPYSSMLEMLQEVVPLLSQAGFLSLIMPHPEAKKRVINQLDHEACKQYCKNIEHAVWVDDIEHKLTYPSLITKVDWIVTVNGSAGFEAMLFGKPVVILGDAPYKVKGMYHPTIEDLAYNKPLDDLYFIHCRKIVAFMIQHYLVSSAYAFTLDFFSRYIERTIKAESLLSTQGATAMTKYLAAEAYLDHSIKNRILAKSVIRERFQVDKSLKMKDQSEIAEVIVQDKSSRGVFTKKKFTKFRRDPAKYFIDSKNPFLHYIGKIMGGRV